MSTSKSSRRWFQFSLASLFWLKLCAAMASYGYREHCERVRLEMELEPSPYYISDGIRYFPSGPEFKLTRESAAMKSYGFLKGKSRGPIR